jgi:integrase/recombinase XerC
MLDSFISYLQFELRSSNHTILSYKNDLNQFLNFLNLQNLSPQSANYSALRSWIINLVEEGNTSRTVNRKIASLRAFYKFLLKRELMDNDPTLKLRTLKTKKSLPHFVEENKIVEALEHPKDLKETDSELVQTRNTLIIELFYGTGIRLSELVSLHVNSISLYDGTIRVIGKRNKERVIPINKTLSELIQKYFDLRKRDLGILPHNFFITTSEGNPPYPKLIYRIVKSRLSSVENLEKTNPHVLRHTFATHLLNKGADLNAIKDLLGHTSLAATQVYTHNSLEKIKAIFNQAHPKA